MDSRNLLKLAGRRGAFQSALKRRAGCLALAMLASFVVFNTVPATASPVELASVNHLSASQSGWIDVHLSAAAPIEIAQGTSPQITIAGAGRILGFTLSRRESDVTKSPVLSALAGSYCDQPACGPLSAPNSFVFVAAFNLKKLSGNRYELTPGDYRLSFITDGAPMSAELSLVGPIGEATLEPLDLTEPVIRQFGPALSDVNGIQPYYSAGGSSPIESDLGFLVSVQPSTMKPHVFTTDATCYYQDSSPPQGLLLPGCPGGISSPRFTAAAIAPGLRVAGLSAAITFSPGVWYQGTYQASVAGQTSRSLAQLWMNL